jgi:hypothetical protein
MKNLNNFEGFLNEMNDADVDAASKAGMDRINQYQFAELAKQIRSENKNLLFNLADFEKGLAGEKDDQLIKLGKQKIQIQALII